MLRKIPAVLFVVLLLPSLAFADTFRGIITETVMQTNDSAYSVGQIVEGWYEYESPTIDGDFGSLAYFGNHHPLALPTLRAYVFTFSLATCGNLPAGWILIGDMGSCFPTNQAASHMVVADGSETIFHADGQMQTLDYGFQSSAFGIRTEQCIPANIGSCATSGTLTFSAPAAVPEMNSAALLGLGLIGLRMAEKRRRKV